MDPVTLLVIIGSAAAVGWFAFSGDDEKKSAPAAGAPAPPTSAVPPAAPGRGPSLPAGKAPISPAAEAAARERLKAAAATAAGRQQITGGAPAKPLPFSMLVGSAVRVTGGSSAWAIGKVGTVLAEDPVTHLLTLAMTADGSDSEFRLSAPIQVARANVVPLSKVGELGELGELDDDMGATIAGITEPEVVGVSAAEAKKYTGGKAVAETTGATLTGAAAGNVIPLVGPIAGAVVGFFAGLGQSIAHAFADSDDDRRRYLYEVGVWPLRHARVKRDVSAHHYAVIQHARMLELAPEPSFGLEKVRAWLTDSKESSAADPTRREAAQRAYFSRLAVAYLARAQVEATKGHSPKPIAMPASRSLVARGLGKFPVQVALDAYLRAYPATVRATHRQLGHHHGAWQRLAAWVAHERRRAHLRTPTPLAVSAEPDAKPRISLPAGPAASSGHRLSLPAGPVTRKDS